MPGLDLDDLSSNWKKLQAKLKSDPKQQLQKSTQKPSANQGHKRKRDGETLAVGGSHTGYDKKRKAPRRDLGSLKTPTKTTTLAPKRTFRKMGATPSQPSPNTSNPPPPPPMSASEVRLASGTSSSNTPILSHHPSTPDTPNTGLHPTNKPGKYLSLDCEMVGTGPPPHSDSLLARASIVNYHGAQIYDSYVLPPHDEVIRDYRTFVSGIRPHHLKPGVARPFKQVQADIAALLDGKILVGHALRNDLRVLMLGHPARDVRDTSRYSGFRVESKGKPPSLRNLVERELGWEGFQRGEHSSVEDARAAMGLFRKEKGGFEEEVRRRFGTSRRGGDKKGGRKGGVEVEDEESEEDEEADEDEEDGSDDEDGQAAAAHKTVKKKRKKKKRTKR